MARRTANATNWRGVAAASSRGRRSLARRHDQAAADGIGVVRLSEFRRGTREELSRAFPNYERILFISPRFTATSSASRAPPFMILGPDGKPSGRRLEAEVQDDMFTSSQNQVNVLKP